MKIEVNKEIKLEFISIEPNASGEIFGNIVYNKSSIELSFNSKLFEKEGEIDVDWEIIKEIAKNVVINLNSLIMKSINVLIVFHQQIFNNEYEEKKGYFDFFGIDIIRSKYVGYSTLDKDSFHNYHIELGFALESETNFVMDYCNYYTTFNSRNTLESVYRM